MVRFLYLWNGCCSRFQQAVFFPLATIFWPAWPHSVSFAIGFFARPLGGIVFGHFGDRIGRKAMLVTTLMMMGVATCLIGVLPTYESIGIAAPIMLIVLRLVQGFGVGGEWGGGRVNGDRTRPQQ